MSDLQQALARIQELEKQYAELLQHAARANDRLQATQALLIGTVTTLAAASPPKWAVIQKRAELIAEMLAKNAMRPLGEHIERDTETLIAAVLASLPGGGRS